MTGCVVLVIKHIKLSGFLSLKMNLLWHVYDIFIYVVLVMPICNYQDTDSL